MCPTLPTLLGGRVPLLDGAKDCTLKRGHLSHYWWYRLRGLLMVPLVLTMVLCTWRETERDALIVLLGGAVFLAGGLLRLWAQMHLHYRLSIEKKLTTTGPYARTRNPVYIGNTLILLGLCVASELLWLCPLVLLYCSVVYAFVVRYEEVHLATKYGAPYREYLRRVPRWLPLRKLSAGAAGRNAWAFLRPSIRSELHVVLFLALPLLKELA